LRIAIVGSKGMLAHDIIKVFKDDRKNELFLYDKHNCDLIHTHIPTKKIFIENPKPDILINCSGYNFVDKAESDADNCYAINSLAVEFLANACNKYGTKLIHFSSDYVFDGEKKEPYREDDETNPLGVYGKSKLYGEISAQKAWDHIVVRTAWLFGENGKNFVDIMISKLKKNKPFKVVSDQFGCPTYSVDLSNAVKRLVDKNFLGLIHITNKNENGISWYDFAIRIAEISNLNKDLITPCSSDKYKTIAKRPKYSTLCCDKFLKSENEYIHPWDYTLLKYLKEKEK